MIMLRFVLSIFFLLLIGTSSIRAETLGLTVNASKILGPVPDILSSSVWISKAGTNRKYHRYQLNRFFSENNPKTIQFTFDVDFLHYSRSFDDFKRKLSELFYPTSVCSLLIQYVKKAGAGLIVGFDPFSMPAWLSSKQGDHGQALAHSGFWTIERVSPPKDYELWGKVVKFTLTFLRNKLGAQRLGFYVGHEPNRDWLGSEESLFKYYEFAARAAKDVSTDIKIGGLGTWSVDARKADCRDSGYTKNVQRLCMKEGKWADPEKEPLVKNFIEYVARHKVPLDFINWHSFGNTPPSRFIEDAQTVEKWLKEAKLKGVALYPSDWTYWGNMSYPADIIDTEETASYYITAIHNMWKGGIDWHGHDFDIEVSSFENIRRKERKNSEFIGDWPVFTRSGVIKPVYNAFKALSLTTGSKRGMATKMIDAEFSFKNSMVAITALKDDGIYLLLSNYVPTIRLESYYGTEKPFFRLAESIRKELSAIKGCAMARMVNKQDDKKSIKDKISECKDMVAERLKDPYKIEALNTFMNMRACLPKEIRNKTLKDIKDKSVKEMNEKTISDTFSCINRTTSQVKNSALKKLIREDILRFSDLFNMTKSVTINYVNLPFPLSSYATTYTVDSRHSNSCKHNKKTEKSSTDTQCGIGGEIDRHIWELRKKIKCRDDIRNCFKSEEIYEQYENGLNKINDSKDISLEGSMQKRPFRVTESGYLLDVDMEPNSIMLIILNKANK